MEPFYVIGALDPAHTLISSHRYSSRNVAQTFHQEAGTSRNKAEPISGAQNVSANFTYGYISVVSLLIDLVISRGQLNWWGDVASSARVNSVELERGGSHWWPCADARILF